MHVEELLAIRREQVERRREAARQSHLADLLDAQAAIEVIDHAIEDETKLARDSGPDRQVRI
jgi:hypothetical protein